MSRAHAFDEAAARLSRVEPVAPLQAVPVTHEPVTKSRGFRFPEYDDQIEVGWFLAGVILVTAFVIASGGYAMVVLFAGLAGGGR